MLTSEKEKQTVTQLDSRKNASAEICQDVFCWSHTSQKVWWPVSILWI